MKFFRFIFSFLYVRNGYTGQWELSRARTTTLAVTITVVIVFFVVALLLQTPVEYQRT